MTCCLYTLRVFPVPGCYCFDFLELVWCIPESGCVPRRKGRQGLLMSSYCFSVPAASESFPDPFFSSTGHCAAFLLYFTSLVGVMGELWCSGLFPTYWWGSVSHVFVGHLYFFLECFSYEFGLLGELRFSHWCSALVSLRLYSISPPYPGCS